VGSVSKTDALNELDLGQLKELADENGVELEGATKEDAVEQLAASRSISNRKIDQYVQAQDGQSQEGYDADSDEAGNEPAANEFGETATAQDADAVTPSGVANPAGIPQSQLAQAPPMQDETGSNLPSSNLRQPVIEGALPDGSPASTEGFDPALFDPEAAAVDRVEGSTSDAASRSEGNLAAETPADRGYDEHPSDGGPERYPFPTGGDVEVATIDAGNGEGEYLSPLDIEDWVVLDGEHELVPERLAGRRAVVLDAPRYLIPVGQEDSVWITVRTRDEVNATLSIPLSAVSEVQKRGIAPAVRG
jgi:hypothetical protein